MLGIETDVLYQWRDLVPTYEARLTPIRGIHVKNVHVKETGTPFTILGDERMPVRDVFLESISIDKAHGRLNHFENVENVHESNVQIRALIPERTARK